MALPACSNDIAHCAWMHGCLGAWAGQRHGAGWEPHCIVSTATNSAPRQTVLQTLVGVIAVMDPIKPEARCVLSCLAASAAQ